MEVSARVNATALWWLPDDRLFDYAGAAVGEWWTSSPIGPAEIGVSTARIRARHLKDGGIELALLTPGGDEVVPRESHIAYTDLDDSDWTYTTPVVLTTAGGRHTCALHTDHAIACWGDNTFGQAAAPAGMFEAIGAGTRHTCAIRADDTIACWGNNTYQQAVPPDGEYGAVTAGERHSCAIRADDTIDCWSANEPRNQ